VTLIATVSDEVDPLSVGDQSIGNLEWLQEHRVGG
jgi:hypothetical protein